MKCPYCRADNDRVIDSRSSQDGLAIRRRRECVNCGRRFTTYERPEETTIKVVKKDGSRVPFEREKIKRGLERACWKRPISSRQIETTTTAIENDVYQQYESEVQSRQVLWPMIPGIALSRPGSVKGVFVSGSGWSGKFPENPPLGRR